MRGLQTWGLVLPLLGVLLATVPFHFAGRGVRVAIEQVVTGFAGAGPWTLAIAHYDVGVYRSSFASALRLGDGSGLSMALRGTVEHGLLATRIRLDGVPAVARHGDPGWPLRVDLRLRHPLPWAGMPGGIAGSLAFDPDHHPDIAPGWSTTAAAVGGRFDCTRGRCRARVAADRVVVAAGPRRGSELDGLDVILATAGPLVVLEVDATLATARLRLPGLSLAVAGLSLAADLAGEDGPPPSFSLAAERLTHTGLPFVRLDRPVLQGTATPPTIGDPRAWDWRLAGESGSNFGPLTWQGRVSRLPGSPEASPRWAVELDGSLPGGLVALVAGRLGIPLDELARRGWIAPDGGRFRVGLVRRFGRWLPGLPGDDGGT